MVLPPNDLRIVSFSYLGRFFLLNILKIIFKISFLKKEIEHVILEALHLFSSRTRY